MTRPFDQCAPRQGPRTTGTGSIGVPSYLDTIDALNTIGGFYHHGGPYDAALASSNVNPRYSPLAAVHDSNMEAIRATPRENLVDSLTRHVPLQGTASVAPGTRDMSGHLMEYTEGADLMREPDAPGGAYKRWPGLVYQPDDLKGKGEPSYSIDRHMASHKHRSMLAAGDLEMLPGVNGRLRRASSAFDASPSSSAAAHSGSPPSASKRPSLGLRRRLGGRKKKDWAGRSDGG